MRIFIHTSENLFLLVCLGVQLLLYLFYCRVKPRSYGPNSLSIYPSFCQLDHNQPTHPLSTTTHVYPIYLSTHPRILTIHPLKYPIDLISYFYFHPSFRVSHSFHFHFYFSSIQLLDHLSILQSIPFISFLFLFSIHPSIHYLKGCTSDHHYHPRVESERWEYLDILRFTGSWSSSNRCGSECQTCCPKRHTLHNEMGHFFIRIIFTWTRIFPAKYINDGTSMLKDDKEKDDFSPSFLVFLLPKKSTYKSQ